MKVLKFGGSSVGNPERIKGVIEIIRKANLEDDVVAVFSAFQGVTDMLIKAAKDSCAGEGFSELATILHDKHVNYTKELVSMKNRSRAIANVKILLNELEDILHGIAVIKELTNKTLDVVQSFGERLSAYIIFESMNSETNNCSFLDARKVLITDSSFANAKVNFEETNKKITKEFSDKKGIIVTTGFIASDSKGNTTTLGRGGSDYTAAIFGAALNVKEIEIWTDVEGILTTDPRKVPTAFSMKDMSYEEAIELSHFGAKVIYPPTMRPAMLKKIPLVIKNTFNPEFAGTKICNKPSKCKYDIKGITSIEDIALIRVQGSGMIGVAGISGRLFNALARNEISVIMITQASSEHSVCFAILPQYKEKALICLKDEFKYEISFDQINEITVEENLSIIAVVGENMRHRVGLAANVFKALARYGVNIVAIAQGSSELNISAVISKKDVSKALNAIHNTFFFDDRKEINIFMVGVGLIGSTFIQQLKERTRFLIEKHNLKPNILGIANSRKMYFDPKGINLENWKNTIEESGIATDLEQFKSQMFEMMIPNKIFIDCTADAKIIEHYNDIIENRVYIVTPNKKANAADYKFYKQLRVSLQKNFSGFFYETNAGAGLPVINTIKDLIASGDEIIKIEGILSGTLSYLFNNFKKGTKFSQLIEDVKGKGYLEPDPRDDLNGMDAGRKILILAREAGSTLELNKMKVQNLIPDNIEINTPAEFWEKLPQFDDHYDKILAEAEKQGSVLRYIGTYENGKASVGLKKIKPEHPFYHITGNENIIAIYTNRYRVNPVIVRGPGAGADVTAAGVFADFLKAAKEM